MSFFGIEIDLLDENAALSAAIVTAVAVAVTIATGGAAFNAVALFAFTYGTSVVTKALLPQEELKGGDQGYLVTPKGFYFTSSDLFMVRLG